MIKGKTQEVQDVGFRKHIEDIARGAEIKGYVFNDIDGSVKLVCCAENNIITKFFKEIRKQKSVTIKKEEIPFQIYLPQKFVRLYTDELVDVGRKLDTGIELLGDIRTNTSTLPTFTTEQSDFNKEMREHNKQLVKILEKLAER